MDVNTNNPQEHVDNQYTNSQMPKSQLVRYSILSVIYFFFFAAIGTFMIWSEYRGQYPIDASRCESDLELCKSLANDAVWSTAQVFLFLAAVNLVIAIITISLSAWKSLPAAVILTLGTLFNLYILFIMWTFPVW